MFLCVHYYEHETHLITDYPLFRSYRLHNAKQVVHYRELICHDFRLFHLFVKKNITFICIGAFKAYHRLDEISKINIVRSI